MRKLLLLALACVLVVAACKPCDDPTDRTCPNYDSCTVAKPTTAYFSIKCWSSWGTSVRANRLAFDSDTINTAYVKFHAAEPNAELYEWTFGSDTTKRYGPDQTVNFAEYAVQTQYKGTVKVTLRVRKAPHPCFPNDSVEKVFSRTLHFNVDAFAYFNGKYRGKWEGQSNETVFTVKMDSLINVAPAPQQPYYAERSFLSGFPAPLRESIFIDVTDFDSTDIFYRQWFFGNYQHKIYPIKEHFFYCGSYMFFSPNKDTMSFSFLGYTNQQSDHVEDWPYQRFTFKGIRIK